jgi:N-carbamoyl-L-amino-acid hydrolase
MTTGIIGTDPNDHAISRIPDAVALSFEVRSRSRGTFEAVYRTFRAECEAVAAQRGVTFAFDDRIVAEPAAMDEGIIAGLMRAAQAVGLPAELIASGAGHDAAIFANSGIPAGMIFVRNQNGSHNPHEAMDLDDFMDGANIMFAFVAGL